MVVGEEVVVAGIWTGGWGMEEGGRDERGWWREKNY
jgi:beta-glucanase (GH16 family)